MITINYSHKDEYINDEYFPGIKTEIIFNDEVTSTDILVNTIKLLNFAGYSLPDEKWLSDFKEELEYRGLLRK